MPRKRKQAQKEGANKEEAQPEIKLAPWRLAAKKEEAEEAKKIKALGSWLEKT